MAKARAIVKRRKAVQNIRKITRTMQLIATARYQQAFNRAMATKPYTEKLTELVDQLSRATEGRIDHPLLRVNKGAGRTALLVVTANRGLCGGYNSNLVHTARDRIRESEAAGLKVELHVVGKKGIGYFRFLGRELTSAITEIEDKPRFSDVNPIAERFIDEYTKGEVDAVHVVYMRFISVGRQVPEVMQLLPLQQVGQAEGAQPAAGKHELTAEDYDFTPTPEEILAELLPMTVKTRLFQCFTDAAVSEQVARMVAMKAATDAAEDMIKYLTRRYNRARQTQITMELLDIMGGAEALT
ncbi:MAG: ATP synthase F1 subunit gamma [Phycisphaerae bacterium]|nr:ATP synthase F1 subunit gamma [Phycisphaerae bacterium]